MDRANNPNRVASVIGKVGSYVTNVTRSARDIPTALGTALDSKGAMATGSNGNNNPKAPITNIIDQVKQVGGAALGKKDTKRSSQYYGPNKTYIDSKTDRGFYLNNPSKLGK